jgi:hypothetical protein
VLRAPAVVAPVLARRIQITLAYSRRGQAKPFLSPPTRVAPFFARAIEVKLAPQSRGKTHSLLTPPTIVRVFTAPALHVALVRNKPVPTVHRLFAPTTVNTPEPVLYPISVTLAYSLRGKPKSFTIFPVKLPFVPPAGDVCGFDIAGSFVCEVVETIVDVCETVTPGTDRVSGMSANESTIDGGDGPAGSVSGSDQESI